MKLAMIQITAGNNLVANIGKMRRYFEDAVQGGAELIAFPEMSYFVGTPEENLRLIERFEELRELFSSWAREERVFLVPGTLREPASQGKYYNTLLLFGRGGETLATYRKNFLFQANLPHKIYDESSRCDRGREVIVAETGRFKVGFGICFDVRFPEHFRRLKSLGAELVLLPSAFTVPTGEAHWRALTQARAIENQFYLAAPAMVGITGEGAATYGHSLCFSPWGEKLGEVESGEGLCFVEIDKSAIEKATQRIDAWACRRDDLFRL